jgi:hypothetical protein
MANRYVRSTDGNNADGGTTWALAKATIAGADAIDTAGDDIWVSQAHSESTAGTITLALAGTRVSPTRLMCGNDATEPPTALATTAVVATTGNTNIIVSSVVGGAAYVYGFTFKAGNGAGTAFVAFSNASGVRTVVESCECWVGSTGTAGGIAAVNNTGNGGETIFKNVGIKFAHVQQQIYIVDLASFNWRGGSVVSGSSAITVLLNITGAGVRALIESVDLSNCGATMLLVAGSSVPGAHVVFRNCKLPASWSGAPSAAITADSVVSMYNCWEDGKNYKLWIMRYAGSIRDETTFVRAGGASDGTTSFSWKMVSLTNCNYNTTPLYTDFINRWQETIGSAITVTVEVLTDSASALNDDQVWLEVDYLGSSGSPLGSTISDGKATVIATAAAQTASSATWTTTGMANPQTRKLSVTFTPQMKGFIRGRIGVGKALATIYVDPKMVVS